MRSEKARSAYEIGKFFDLLRRSESLSPSPSNFFIPFIEDLIVFELPRTQVFMLISGPVDFDEDSI